MSDTSAPIAQDTTDTRDALTYAIDMRDAVARMIARDTLAGFTPDAGSVRLFGRWEAYLTTL